MPRKSAAVVVPDAVLPPTDKAALEKVKGIVRHFDKAYGTGTVMLGSDLRYQRIPRVSSGVFELDVALGGDNTTGWGWPRGRMVQIAGPESAGKTLLFYLHTGIIQKHCHWCCQPLPKCDCGAQDPIIAVMEDIESTHDPKWAKRLGVDNDALVLVRPPTGEAVVNSVRDLMLAGDSGFAVGLIGIDSIAQITPEEMLVKEAGEESVSPASLARLMSLGTKKWQACLNHKMPHPTQRTEQKNPKTGKTEKVPVRWDNNCTVMCLNQLRESISRTPVAPAPPGGRAARHMWSIDLRLAFAHGADLKWDDVEADEQSAVQQTIHFITHKNKTHAPKRKGIFTIDFEKAAVDNTAQLLRLARRYGLVDVAGSWWSYGEVREQGAENFAMRVFEDKNLLRQISTDLTPLLEGPRPEPKSKPSNDLEEEIADKKKFARKKARKK